MAKLKMVNAYNANDVPESILQEVMDLTSAIGKALSVLPHSDPNILLSALGRFYAAMIVQVTTDDPDEKRRTAFVAAKALILNIEHMSGIKILGDEGKEI